MGYSFHEVENKIKAINSKAGRGTVRHLLESNNVKVAYKSINNTCVVHSFYDKKDINKMLAKLKKENWVEGGITKPLY